MPLTEKGRKIKSALVEEYGHEKGRQVFYAMKNAGKITGVDSSEKADDNQHMGFTSGQTETVKKLITSCDSLAARMDAFERRRSMRRPVDVKPRTKDNMQPSNPHPKEVG